jgi:hypothetical protein
MHGPVRFALPALAMMTLAVGAGSAGRPVIMVVPFAAGTATAGTPSEGDR